MNPIVGWEFMRKDLKATPAGSETVEGYPCRVVECRRPGDSRVSNRVWHSDELGFAIKEEAYAMNGTSTMALRNIKQGPVDAEVLSDLIRDLPDDSVVGLTAYGHRRKGDCGDVEELVPLGVIDKDRLIKTVHGLKPKGKTPITLSVRMAAEKIRHLEEETTIILVSDGEETCEGDPCALVRELKEAGIHFVMHVIGFDVTEKEHVQLQCMADAGGGRYYTANSAHEFQTAAREVVREKTVEKGFLRLTALRGDTPFRAAVEVRAAGESTVIKGGVTGTDPERPGASIVPGVYDLRFQDVEMPDHPDVWIRGVEVKGGETVEPGKAVTANAAFPVEEKPPARGENPVPAPTPGQGGDADNEPLSTSSKQAGGKDLEERGKFIMPGASVLKEQTIFQLTVSPEILTSETRHSLFASSLWGTKSSAVKHCVWVTGGTFMGMPTISVSVVISHFPGFKSGRAVAVQGAPIIERTKVT